MDMIHNQDLHDITIKHYNTEDNKILIKMITSILSKIALIYCLVLKKVEEILDFTLNVISNVVFYHTTISGILENRMVNTQSINLLQLCQKLH